LAQEQNPQQFLLQQLEAIKPQSLLWAAPGCPAAITQWCAEHHCKLCHCDNEQLPENQRFDLAITSGLLEQLPKQAGNILIGTIRNTLSPRLLLMYQASTQASAVHQPWQPADFFALGLKRVTHSESTDTSNDTTNDKANTAAEDDTDLEIYGYDLANYQFKRSWNSPKYWANPENWGKYWW
jgi:hypothetical protein